MQPLHAAGPPSASASAQQPQPRPQPQPQPQQQQQPVDPFVVYQLRTPAQRGGAVVPRIRHNPAPSPANYRFARVLPPPTAAGHALAPHLPKSLEYPARWDDLSVSSSLSTRTSLLSSEAPVTARSYGSGRRRFEYHYYPPTVVAHHATPPPFAPGGASPPAMPNGNGNEHGTAGSGSGAAPGASPSQRQLPSQSFHNPSTVPPAPAAPAPPFLPYFSSHPHDGFGDPQSDVSARGDYKSQSRPASHDRPRAPGAAAGSHAVRARTHSQHQQHHFYYNNQQQQYRHLHQHHVLPEVLSRFEQEERIVEQLLARSGGSKSPATAGALRTLQQQHQQQQRTRAPIRSLGADLYAIDDEWGPSSPLWEPVPRFSTVMDPVRDRPPPPVLADDFCRPAGVTAARDGYIVHNDTALGYESEVGGSDYGRRRRAFMAWLFSAASAPPPPNDDPVMPARSKLQQERQQQQNSNDKTRNLPNALSSQIRRGAERNEAAGRGVVGDHPSLRVSNLKPGTRLTSDARGQQAGHGALVATKQQRGAVKQNGVAVPSREFNWVEDQPAGIESSDTNMRADAQRNLRRSERNSKNVKPSKAQAAVPVAAGFQSLRSDIIEQKELSFGQLIDANNADIMMAEGEPSEGASLPAGAPPPGEPHFAEHDFRMSEAKCSDQKRTSSTNDVHSDWSNPYATELDIYCQCSCPCIYEVECRRRCGTGSIHSGDTFSLKSGSCGSLYPLASRQARHSSRADVPAAQNDLSSALGVCSENIFMSSGVPSSTVNRGESKVRDDYATRGYSSRLTDRMEVQPGNSCAQDQRHRQVEHEEKLDPSLFEESGQAEDMWAARAGRRASASRRHQQANADSIKHTARSRTRTGEEIMQSDKTAATNEARTRQRAQLANQREVRTIAPEKKPGFTHGATAARTYSMPGQKEGNLPSKSRRAIGESSVHSRSFTEGSGEQRLRILHDNDRDFELPALGRMGPARGSGGGDRFLRGPRDMSDARRTRKHSLVHGSTDDANRQQLHRVRQSHVRPHSQSRRKRPTQPEGLQAGFVGAIRRILRF